MHACARIAWGGRQHRARHRTRGRARSHIPACTRTCASAWAPAGTNERESALTFSSLVSVSPGGAVVDLPPRRASCVSMSRCSVSLRSRSHATLAASSSCCSCKRFWAAWMAATLAMARALHAPCGTRPVPARARAQERECALVPFPAGARAVRVWRPAGVRRSPPSPTAWPSPMPHPSPLLVGLPVLPPVAPSLPSPPARLFPPPVHAPLPGYAAARPRRRLPKPACEERRAAPGGGPARGHSPNAFPERARATKIQISGETQVRGADGVGARPLVTRQARLAAPAGAGARRAWRGRGASASASASASARRRQRSAAARQRGRSSCLRRAWAPTPAEMEVDPAVTVSAALPTGGRPVLLRLPDGLDTDIADVKATIEVRGPSGPCACMLHVLCSTLAGR